MTETQLILARLDEMREQIAENTRATNQVVTANAVLTERVGNLIEKVDGHLDDDEEIHEAQDKKIAALDKWRTELKTKIATYASIAAVVIGVLYDAGKEALAHVFGNGG